MYDNVSVFIIAKPIKQNLLRIANMQRSLSVFVFLLSCGLGSKNTETLSYIHNDVWYNDITCMTTDDCQSYILSSECREGKCICVGDSFLSSDTTKCLKPVEGFGCECEDNVQCSKALSVGGVCMNGGCKCKQGYHYLKGKCWKNIDLGEKCHKGEQCFSAYEYIGLECDKTCKCRSEYYQRLNSGCRRKSKGGEFCNLDGDCTESKLCQGLKCAASVKLEPKTAFSDLFVNTTSVIELGMSCTKNEDCASIGKAICLDKICACPPNIYVASENNKNCLQVSRGKVDDISRTSCKEDAQCGVYGGNSLCKNRKCSCKEGTYWEKNHKFCWKIKSLNENCDRNEDCYPTERNTKCANGRCTCQEGYHQKENTCVPDAIKVGDHCEEDEECLFKYSFCDSSNSCVCKPYYYVENQKCTPGVGSSCTKDEDCAHLKNTKCEVGNTTTKQCICLETYTNSPDYKYCLSVSQYKEKCEESLQCQFHLGKYGECRNKICECSNGTHYSSGKCYKSKFVREPCSRKSECYPGNDVNSVICLKGYCACQYDYKLDENGICVKTNSGTSLKVHLLLLTSLMFVFASSR